MFLKINSKEKPKAQNSWKPKEILWKHFITSAKLKPKVKKKEKLTCAENKTRSLSQSLPTWSR